MALEIQHYIYSLDTSCFYTQEEKAIHDRMTQLYILRGQVTNLIEKHEMDIVKELKKARKSCKKNETPCYHFDKDKIDEIESLKKIKSTYNKMIGNLKLELCNEFDRTKKKGIIRVLSDESFSTKKVVSIFSSSLTRAMGLKRNELTKDIMVVQAYFFQVLEDIIKQGFIYNGEEYTCFTASAGQIRLKKTVFIKKSVLDNIENRITCGLTIDKINEKGGMNVNKYLAYLALCNSATDIWSGFNIRKAIVVDDFETMVEAHVDVIDDKDYSISREHKAIPIPHMDGCGIKLYGKTSMVRLPYIKGLLGKFDYIKFIKEKGCSPIVTDIYGKQYDIIKDDIQYIFTKSQFKMWKYYDSWEEYQNNFEVFGCEACICNEEELDIPDAKINYQMLQTLFDMKTGEIEKICEKSMSEINELGRNKDVMLDVLGVNGSNKNYMQQALSIYPELLNDPYNREIMKDTKASLVKNAKAGKLKVNGKFTFILPDLYAFCEWLFLGIETPQGLLQDGEVYCNLYKDKEKLDCLRSPHLFIEHAVRNNVANNKERYDQLKDWFCTKSLYTSTHDVISRILQFDVDGDKSLVLADETIIGVAEREIKEYDIVPLYYNMSKAPAMLIDKNTIYDGLISAYKSGNIGLYSNNISIILNSSDMVSNNKERRMKALNTIKLLCMENNFVIDSAKTLYVPTRPNKEKELITSYTNHKLPYFFVYAKDKLEKQVEPQNNSAMNKIGNAIKDTRMYFADLGLQKPDYRLLMSDFKFKSNRNQQAIIDMYDEINAKSRFYFIDKEFEIKELNNKIYLYDCIRKEFEDKYENLDLIVNTLVETLYEKRKSSTKKLLWDCFGDIIVRNLENNIPKYTTTCEKCGVRIVKSGKVTKYCDKCAKEIKKEQDRTRKRK